MDYRQILTQGEVPMKKTIEKVRNEFSAIRTGRANAAILDSVKVESYGSLLPINQLGNISASDGRTLEIRPWDITVLPAIEKAILKSELGLTPANDGKIIRLSLPSLTEERRKELIKVVHKIAEDFRISVRNERRTIAEHLKKAEKDKQITEDDKKHAETALQKITDDYIKKIDEILKIKEKEIMEV